MHSHYKSNAQDDSLAQLVEHNTFNVGVLGSSPSGITRERKVEAFLFSFSGRRDRFYPAGSRASAASGQRSPESRSTYSHSRPPARLSFGGSLQHWLIAERLTPYLAAASRSVSNTSPVVMHLTFRLRRRSIALTEHFRQPEERDFVMRPYACADHTWPQALHSNVMRVWLLTYSVRGTISGCNRFNLSTNRSCVSFNLPAQLAHPEPRRRVVGATDHS